VNTLRKKWERKNEAGKQDATAGAAGENKTAEDEAGKNEQD
jgi:hypothetical protein